MGKIMGYEDGVYCGDKIVITGICIGKRFNVIMKNCVIDKVIYSACEPHGLEIRCAVFCMLL